MIGPVFKPDAWIIDLQCLLPQKGSIIMSRSYAGVVGIDLEIIDIHP
jgi:hypothetical protein